MAVKILSTCSSRDRPGRCKEMIDSFVTTRQEDTRLFIYVDIADERIIEYMQLQQSLPPGVEMEIGEHKNLVEVLNYGPSINLGMDYFHEVNDDHIFRTVGWDTKLAAALDGKIGISYPRLEHLPSSIMMSGELLRRIGFFAFPAFTHSWVDNFFKELGEDIGCMVHVPDVWIEHCHWSFGKVPMDSVYEKVVAEQNGPANLAAYHEWQSQRKEIVRRALNG